MLTALGHSVSLDSVCGTGIQTVEKEILKCGLELLGDDTDDTDDKATTEIHAKTFR